DRVRGRLRSCSCGLIALNPASQPKWGQSPRTRTPSYHLRPMRRVVTRALFVLVAMTAFAWAAAIPTRVQISIGFCARGAAASCGYAIENRAPLRAAVVVVGLAVAAVILAIGQGRSRLRLAFSGAL